MKYGITPTGYTIPNFDEEKAIIEGSIENTLGAVDFEAPSVISVFTNVNSTEVMKLWEASQETHYANFLDTATGVSLDYKVAEMGISRQLPTNSKVMCQLTGEMYTTIPAYTQFSQRYTSKLFSSSSDLVLNNNACFAVKIIVDDLEQDTFQVKINEAIISYEKQVNDTEFDILTAIKANEDIIGDFVTEIFTDYIVIKSTTISNVFSCYVQDGLRIIEVTNSFQLLAEDKGYVPVPARSITEIQNAVTGLISIDNLTSGETGRDLESDIELRARAKESLSISGNGTVLAIKAKLLQLSGVTAVTVTDDDTAHTISALVVGGDDDEIARTIFESKPAGIPTLGLVEKVVQDIYYSNHTVRFSRPQKIFVFVKITLTTTDAFRDEYIYKIKEKVALLFKDKKIGDSVQYQAIFSAIYSVEGVTNSAVTIAGTPVESVEPTTFNATNIVLQNTQVAVTDTNKISIEIEA